MFQKLDLTKTWRTIKIDVTTPSIEFNALKKGARREAGTASAKSCKQQTHWPVEWGVWISQQSVNNSKIMWGIQ